MISPLTTGVVGAGRLACKLRAERPKLAEGLALQV